MSGRFNYSDNAFTLLYHWSYSESRDTCRQDTKTHSGHLHRMRTFHKTKWKTCDLFLPSWHSGRLDKGLINRREPSLKLQSLALSRREVISRASQTPSVSVLFIPQGSSSLLPFVLGQQAAQILCFLRDSTVIFLDSTVGLFNLNISLKSNVRYLAQHTHISSFPVIYCKMSSFFPVPSISHSYLTQLNQ